MTLFLGLLLLAAMFATLFVLIRGLVNMAGTTHADLQGEGPSERALKSNKLMWARIKFQLIAVVIIAILFMFSSAQS